jgi:hypothetical protein
MPANLLIIKVNPPFLWIHLTARWLMKAKGGAQKNKQGKKRTAPGIGAVLLSDRSYRRTGPPTGSAIY